jgi:hypothetical protein
MKKVIIFVLIIVGILFLLRFVIGGPEDSWICKDGSWIKHGQPSYPKPITKCSKQTTLPKNEEDCLKENGVWKKLGPEPFESCNRKAVDRGNLCQDSSECEGLCQISLINAVRKLGQCSVWVIELGCQQIMKNGQIQTICID